MAARKPTKLNAPATMTAIQLAQNGTSTPFKVTDHPITIRINCRSAIRAKMAAASVQKVLMVIARLRWHTRTCSPPQPKWGGAGVAATPLKQGSGLTEPFSITSPLAPDGHQVRGCQCPFLRGKADSQRQVWVPLAV